MISWIRTGLAISAMVLAGALGAPVAEAAKPPDGSYRQSCRHIEVDTSGGKYRVSAQCQDRQGKWLNSTLRYDKCQNQRVGNDNGTLVCESSGGGQLPGGSWDQSCRNGTMQNGMLYAQCQRADGGRRDSSIDARRCNGGRVANDNGNLVCESGGGGGQLPGGSWSQSCRNATLQKGTLYAQCQRADGGWRDSSIDPRGCSGNRVGNNNGNLVCEN